ncbi:Flotillin-1, partial [Eudyptes schlegeli]
QEIYKDRQKFSEQVFNVASSDLVNMGISVVSYTLKDIHDDQVALGGDMGGDTRWGSREEGRGDEGTQGWRYWDKDRGMAVWGHRAKDGDAGTGTGSPGVGVETGEPQTGTGTGLTKQQIEEQRAQVLVVERAQQAQLQEHEIGRRERELEATVRKPAEAERYRLERLAEAQR